MILIFLTLITALTLSAVAAFYSIVGLTTIFAASVVPVIIMAGILEVGKLVTTVWLHENWHRVKLFMRVYLCVAVVILMIITSMGIFGFLSKAHIEQASNAAQGQAQIERVVAGIEQQENIVARANTQIAKLESEGTNTNTSVREQIDAEQQRIDTTYARIQPAIAEQNAIIANARIDDGTRTAPYETQLTNLSTEIQYLTTQVENYERSLRNLGTDTAGIDAVIRPYVDQINSINRDVSSLQNLTVSGNRDDIKRAQQLVGISADGIFGNASANATDEWKDKQSLRIAELSATITQLRKESTRALDSERTRITGLISAIQTTKIPDLKDRELEVLAVIDKIRRTESPVITTARDEITRIRTSADLNIAASQTIIDQLRAKIQIGLTADTDILIDAQRT